MLSLGDLSRKHAYSQDPFSPPEDLLGSAHDLLDDILPSDPFLPYPTHNPTTHPFSHLPAHNTLAQNIILNLDDMPSLGPLEHFDNHPALLSDIPQTPSLRPHPFLQTSATADIPLVDILQGTHDSLRPLLQPQTHMTHISTLPTFQTPAAPSSSTMTWGQPLESVEPVQNILWAPPHHDATSYAPWTDVENHHANEANPSLENSNCIQSHPNSTVLPTISDPDEMFLYFRSDLSPVSFPTLHPTCCENVEPAHDGLSTVSSGFSSDNRDFKSFDAADHSILQKRGNIPASPPTVSTSAASACDGHSCSITLPTEKTPSTNNDRASACSLEPLWNILLSSSTIHARREAQLCKPRGALRWCHICAKECTTSQHIICDGVADKTQRCARCVCQSCFDLYGWDWFVAQKDEAWRCMHCTGTCPPVAQCHVKGSIRSAHHSLGVIGSDPHGMHRKRRGPSGCQPPVHVGNLSCN